MAGLFQKMDWKRPINYGMSGAEFASFLLSNPNQRFFVDSHVQWEWKPYAVPPTYPFEVRMECTQGHTNKVVNPFSLHHPLTYDEAMCLGCFLVTDVATASSIQNSGLVTDPKGHGKGGRDSVHFMYHNGSAPGYIRMAEGTEPPRHYKQPVYFVLFPDFCVTRQLFLPSNGVVLFYGNVPPLYLKQVEQLPTVAMGVLRPGRGHMLPSSVTGGTWPWDIAFEHVKKEKGTGFVEGGDIPNNIRNTAWQFTGHGIPPNYGKLVFGPLGEKSWFWSNSRIHSWFDTRRLSKQKGIWTMQLISQWATHMDTRRVRLLYSCSS